MPLSAQVLSAIFGALASGLLAALVGMLRGIRRDVRQFMTEHMWLIATANWSRTTIMQIMQELGIQGEQPPDMARHRK